MEHITKHFLKGQIELYSQRTSDFYQLDFKLVKFYLFPCFPNGGKFNHLYKTLKINILLEKSAQIQLNVLAIMVPVKLTLNFTTKFIKNTVRTTIIRNIQLHI